MKPYIPQKLPLKNINWEFLIEDIAKANRALAKYDGLLQIIPNPKLLLAPLTIKEAVLSSKIEGTQATFEDVLNYEANPTKEVKNFADIQEVINYRKAIEYAITRLNELPLSVRLIKEIHKILLSGVRGSNKNPGNFRNGQVFIGKKGVDIQNATYIPPDPQLIDEYMTNLEKYMHYEEKDTLVQLSIIHAQFEIIHPFWDGNGRTGRILIPIFLYSKDIIGMPMFYLSEYLETHREDYYNYLNNVSKEQDWESWIQFFLKAITQQSINNINKINKIVTLYNELKNEIVDMPTPKNSIKVLDFLFSTPIFSSKKMENQTGIEKRSIYRVISFLIDKKIISSDEKERNKTFYFDELLKIIA
ncbi:MULTISPECIES: Fic family protein [unclassified Nitratiruptor]|uniref:Fic family protein n=1 Tax=unclassified Nitratiruptor TaxID=2624044 RepID=UPI0019167842|nr:MULTISPECIES: Fic/DOC family N-terminal domain-containing protein [unclassified Nitratiruptor]BCD59336.1 hypothetical protein NitYY0810_C0066 [Nitratiruptor sp. YY08-10]BCD63260.1 hypothetical protein NitYY0814_C0066 [Nitratiruptor sp. YY08-14]